MKESTAMQNLPPYLFARIEKKIEAARQQGLDVINLGIGDPDQPTPEHIIAALTRAVHDPANHQYPSSVGLLLLSRNGGQLVSRQFWSGAGSRYPGNIIAGFERGYRPYIHGLSGCG